MASKVIELLIRFAVDPKDRATFDEVTRTLVAGIEANEPNTIGYSFFVADDGASAVLHERYPDSAAFIAHMARTGALLGPLLAIAKPVSVYVLGEVNAEARAILDGFGAKYLAPAAAITR